jgi:hypothetical protein
MTGLCNSNDIPYTVISAFSAYKASIYDILCNGMLSKVIPDIIHESRTSMQNTEIDKNIIERNTSVQTILGPSSNGNDTSKVRELNERIIVEAKLDELITYLFRYIPN